MRLQSASALTLILLLLSCCSSVPNEGKRWLIEPSGNVGGITPSSSLEDVVRLFGSQNVAAAEIPVGEGETVQGTGVYPGSPNILEIEWKQDAGRPQRITVSGAGTKWKTGEGITVGSTLEEVEAANGGPFLITGLAWDYPGRSVSWEGGRLAPELQLEFTVSEGAAEEDISQVVGDRFFPTDHEAVRRLGLRVSRLYILW